MELDAKLAKKVVGGAGTIGFLVYQYAELARQNYDLVQRVVKLEERQALRFGDMTREEAILLKERQKK